MASFQYFDRNCDPLALLKWAELFERDDYRFVERTWVVPEVLEVVTVWEGFDPYRTRFEDAPLRIFRVAELDWVDGVLRDACEHAMPSTEVEARTVHHAVVSALRARRTRASSGCEGDGFVRVPLLEATLVPDLFSGRSISRSMTRRISCGRCSSRYLDGKASTASWNPVTRLSSP